MKQQLIIDEMIYEIVIQSYLMKLLYVHNNMILILYITNNNVNKLNIYEVIYYKYKIKILILETKIEICKIISLI